MSRTVVLRDRGRTLTHTFYNDAETATDADGDVTVAVVRENGDTLSTGTATSVGSGVYSFVLDPQSQLDVLAVSWTGTFSGVTWTETDEVEVVGAHIATVSDVRGLDSMNDTSRYPTADVERTIDEVSQLFEDYCNVSFRPRYHRLVTTGSGADSLMLDRLEARSLIDVTIEDPAGTVTTQTITAWDIVDGYLLVADDVTFPTSPTNNVAVRYEHGLAQPPADLRRALLTYVRARLLSDLSGIDPRTTTLSEDGMTFTFAATVDRPTAIPEVDAVLKRYRRLKTGVR